MKLQPNQFDSWRDPLLNSLYYNIHIINLRDVYLSEKSSQKFYCLSLLMRMLINGLVRGLGKFYYHNDNLSYL